MTRDWSRVELRVQLLKHVADEFIRIDVHDIHILNSAQFMVFLTLLVYSYIAIITFSDNLYTAKSECHLWPIR